MNKICCQKDCKKKAEWIIKWGDAPDDYTESCNVHIGELCGVHEGQDFPEFFQLYPLEESE